MSYQRLRNFRIQHYIVAKIRSTFCQIKVSSSDQQNQHIAKREQLLNQITRQIGSSLDLKIILNNAIAQLCRALAADRCLVHLVEDLEDFDAQNPDLCAQLQSSQEIAFRRKHLYEFCQNDFSSCLEDFDTHGPITEWVITNREGVVIPDVSRDERIGAHNPEYQKANIYSSLVVPVQTEDKLYGIIYLNQCSRIRAWSQDEEHLTQTVADQLAIAIQQAHLYAQTRQQALKSEAQAQQLATTLKELQITQAQLIQSEKMSSLDQMVSGVAHELNNPISFIYGNIPYLETHLKDLLEIVRAYQHHYPQPHPDLAELVEDVDLEFLCKDIPNILKSMKAGSHRIKEIVEVLQNFSRLNEAPIKAIDLRSALASTLLICNSQIENKIEIQYNYTDIPAVECYPKEINQALLSLIINAIEALNRCENELKVITLGVEKIAATGSEPEKVEIAIADNGMGIPLDIQSRIFDPFFTTKDIGQGRGLGLTSAYQIIVEQHQGKISLTSKPNQGTTFILEIPVHLASNHISEADFSLSNSQRSEVVSL